MNETQTEFDSIDISIFKQSQEITGSDRDTELVSELKKKSAVRLLPGLIGEEEIIFREGTDITDISLKSLLEESLMNYEKSLIDTFLMTHEYVISKMKLFKVLLILFYHPHAIKGNQKQAPIFCETVRYRIFKIIKRWIALKIELLQEKNNWYSLLRAFINDLLCSSDPKHYYFGCSMVKEWEVTMKEFLKDRNDTSLVGLQSNQDNTGANFLDFKSVDVAKQLTREEQDVFQKINLKEFFKGNWNSEETAPSVHSFIAQVNRNSYWVATTVVTGFRQDQDSVVQDDNLRSLIISKWLDVLGILIDMKNFNTAMEIYLGLNMDSVCKLKCWSLVSKSALENLNRFENYLKSNYKEYRAQIQTEGPCIPILSVILSDLTFLEEIPDEEDCAVNITKMRLLSKIFSSISEFKKNRYNIECSSRIEFALSNRHIIENPQKLDDISEYLSFIEENTQKNTSKKELKLFRKRRISKEKKKQKKNRKDSKKFRSMKLIEAKYDLDTAEIDDVCFMPLVLDEFSAYISSISTKYLPCLLFWKDIVKYESLVSMNSNKTAECLEYIYNTYLGQEPIDLVMVDDEDIMADIIAMKKVYISTEMTSGFSNTIEYLREPLDLIFKQFILSLRSQ
eukprot:TRINITY_DN3387_c0_g1_i1.p1 TRINITY_DN3387_c0_g1~~TRINITY_DN3387_c0_g1_i1.p1  ORF type:complete len:623 (-),score=119.30 TRINITY_DN3387_c0_g1_i1:76-1944(-)